MQVVDIHTYKYTYIYTYIYKWHVTEMHPITVQLRYLQTCLFLFISIFVFVKLTNIIFFVFDSLHIFTFHWTISNMSNKSHVLPHDVMESQVNLTRSDPVGRDEKPTAYDNQIRSDIFRHFPII